MDLDFDEKFKKEMDYIDSLTGLEKYHYAVHKILKMQRESQCVEYKNDNDYYPKNQLTEAEHEHIGLIVRQSIEDMIATGNFNTIPWPED